MANETKTCPFCAEDIKKEAVICRFCGYDLRSGTLATQTPISATIETTRKRSTIADGVRIGFGMFIVLPILLVLGVCFFIGMCSVSSKGVSPVPQTSSPGPKALSAAATKPANDRGPDVKPTAFPVDQAVAKGLSMLERFPDLRKAAKNEQYDDVDRTTAELAGDGLISQVRYDRVREFLADPSRDLSPAQLRDWEDLCKKAVRWVGVVDGIRSSDKDNRLYVSIKMDQRAASADIVLRVHEKSRDAANRLSPGMIVDFLGFAFGPPPRQRPVRLDNSIIIANLNPTSSH